ncbi:MAG: hypothetical protein IKP61_11455 [Spirochaetales bacterium]|nr:hypothetical protein [Spirochaetales bacterium]
MKNKTLISTFLFLFLALSVLYGENDLHLTYTQRVRSRDMEVRLNAENIAYTMTVRQNLDGSFTLLSPPFLTAEFGHTLRVGELKDARLLSLMLDPMSAKPDFAGFRHGSNFSHITSPSMNPVLSGLALSFDHLDIFSFSPILNPRSPSGFGFIAGTGNVFAGVLCATQNRMAVKASTPDYQVNWRQLGIGKNMLFSIIGASAEAEAFGLEIKSTVFLQNAFDALLGGGSTIGWSMEADTGLLKISLFGKTGGFGVKLKRLTDDLSPKQSFGAGLSCLRQGMGLDLEYRSDTYEVPVYGGNSQKRTISYQIGASWRKNKLKVSNTTSFDLDRGKVQSTDYLLSVEEFGAKLEASFTLNRPLGAPSFYSGGKLRLTTEHARLEASPGKVLLQMSWNIKREDYEIGFSIDQDRRITAGLSFKGI